MHGRDWNKAGDLIAYIKQRAGLLLERAPRTYTFPHRSYQEYMAAQCLAIQEEFPQEAARLVLSKYSQWRDVTLWTVAITARLKKYIHVAVDTASALCDDRPPHGTEADPSWRSAIVAGQALEEIGLDVLKKRPRYGDVLNLVLG